MPRPGTIIRRQIGINHCEVALSVVRRDVKMKRFQQAMDVATGTDERLQMAYWERDVEVR